MSMVDITPAERRIAERVNPAITNNLTVSDQAGGVQFANADEVMEWAKMMSVASSGVRKHLRGNPGACLAICVQALEWGMSSFAVANKSYFVNDQIAFESQLIQAVILKRAPIKGRIKFEFSGEGPNRICRAWARLRDDPDEIVEYVSPLFKDISPKNSPLWKADPDQQHCYMAGRALCRRHFPDVLLGVYADDEIDRDPRPAIGPDRARDVSAPRTLSSKLDALAGFDVKPSTTAAAEQIAGQSQDGAAAGAEVADKPGEEQNPVTAPVEILEDTPRDLLIIDLRDAIDNGARVSKLLNDLGDRRDILTDDDVKALHARAKKAQE